MNDDVRLRRPGHWYEHLADRLGEHYLDLDFTKGTDQEVAFLVDAFDLRPGSRVLDVGCGPGRHARRMAERGIDVVGIDISDTFLDIARRDAPATATFLREDARDLAFEAEFDLVLSLCQGAFGLMGGPASSVADPEMTVLHRMGRAARPGGRVCFTAFSAYFAMQHLDLHDGFDAASGVHYERFRVDDREGRDDEEEAWTTTFTPRELRLMVHQVDLTLQELWSVAPGAYDRTAPTLSLPEFLVVARRPE